tara:strand:- start:40 stop:609 length:570 start_codon:yes stop_codon:yes gene_type:complete
MARKIKAKTQNDGWKEPTKKVRKKRKPMSEKQRQEAAARLAIAREKKKIENPTFGMSGIHPSLHNLKDDHPISVKKVKEWIKTQRGIVSTERSAERQNVKGAKSRRMNAEGYIRHMNHYLKTGDWVAMFYGEHEQTLVKRRCVAMAYYPDGTPKRDVGVYYPDMGCVYTKEMYEEDKILNVKGNKRALA